MKTIGAVNMGMVYHLGIANSLLADNSNTEKLQFIRQFAEFCKGVGFNEIVDNNVWTFVWQQEENSQPRVTNILYEDYFDNMTAATYILDNYKSYNGDAPYRFLPDMSDTTIFVPGIEVYARKIELPENPLDQLIYSGLMHLAGWVSEQLEEIHLLPELIDDVHHRDDYVHFLTHLNKCCAAAENLDVCLIIY